VRLLVLLKRNYDPVIMSSVTKPVEGEFVGHVAAHNAKEKKKFPFKKLFPSTTQHIASLLY